MLPWVCSVIDHRRRQNVVRTSVTHSAIASCATFLFLPHFDVICDLLLNRRTATWNLFVKWTSCANRKRNANFLSYWIQGLTRLLNLRTDRHTYQRTCFWYNPAGIHYYIDRKTIPCNSYIFQVHICLALLYIRQCLYKCRQNKNKWEDRWYFLGTTLDGLILRLW